MFLAVSLSSEMKAVESKPGIRELQVASILCTAAADDDGRFAARNCMQSKLMWLDVPLARVLEQNKSSVRYARSRALLIGSV